MFSTSHKCFEQFFFCLFQIPVSAIPPFVKGEPFVGPAIHGETVPLHHYESSSGPQRPFGRGFGSSRSHPGPRPGQNLGSPRQQQQSPSRSPRGGKSSVITSGLGKKVVTTITKHVCSFCEKEFQTQSGLWKHMSSHTGKYSYTCPTCNKGFNEKHIFESHINMHEGIGFTCMRCKKTFYQKALLVSHQKKCNFM